MHNIPETKLNEILKTCEYVVENCENVKINYNKINLLIEDLFKFENTHYLTKVPYDIYGMNTSDIINFLLIYDSIDFSFWGTPKWTIQADGKNLDGGIALLHCIYNLFDKRSSIEVYKKLENMSLNEFKNILKGNIEIPLIEERHKIVTEIAKKVNKRMNGSFYEHIKNMNTDIEIFNFILENFKNFKDTRIYKDKTIYFYKLAQLLTSDILHVFKIKEKRKVDYSHLIGCADYKIPQVLNGFGILEYSKELNSYLENKKEIPENSEYEIEIRASMIIVIDYIYQHIDKSIDRIDINDFIWGKGQDKTRNYKPYHLTRTTSY